MRMYSYYIRVGCRCATSQSTVSTFSASLFIHADSLAPSNPCGHRSGESPKCDRKFSQMVSISLSIWVSSFTDGCCSSRDAGQDITSAMVTHEHSDYVDSKLNDTTQLGFRLCLYHCSQAKLPHMLTSCIRCSKRMMRMHKGSLGRLLLLNFAAYWKRFAC